MRIARDSNAVNSGRRKGHVLSGHMVMEARPTCQANDAKDESYEPCNRRLVRKRSGGVWHCERHGEMHIV